MRTAMMVKRRGHGDLDRRGGVLAGCLIAVGIVLLLLIAGGIFVAVKWRGWVADGTRATTSQLVAELNLSDEQRVAIETEVDTVATDFENGDMTVEEFFKVIEQLSKSPAMPAAAVIGAYNEYIEPSQLSDDEKADARRQLERLARGIVDKQLTAEEINRALAPVTKRPEDSNSDAWIDYGNGRINLNLQEPSAVSDVELREFIAETKAVTDEAAIPDESFEVDIAMELRRAVDRARGRELRDPEPEVEAPADEEVLEPVPSGG